MDPGSGAFLFCSADESIHARLRQNDEEFTDLQLWLNASSNIPNLTDALWHNTSIQEALLLIHESFGENQPEHEVLLLFAVLGRLPRLSRLFFNTYRFPFVATLPVKCMSNVFRSARNLVEFKLWRTDLCISTTQQGQYEPQHKGQDKPQKEGHQQLQEWAKALASSRSLREFRLIKCRLTTTTDATAIGDNTSTIRRRTSRGMNASTTATNMNNVDDDPCCGFTLDLILQALAKLPNLTDVELSATKLAALGNLSQTTLRQILQAPSLQSFSLTNFDLSEDAVITIAKSLLQQSNLHDSTTAKGSHQSSTRVSQSTTSSCLSSNNRNNTINSSRVRNLRLSNVGSTVSMFAKPVREAFRQVLHYNYQLERLFLFDTRNLQEEISFYLKLNRLGRQRLMRHQASRQEWIETLVHVRDDLDCLFYFLGIHPLFLQCQSQEQI